MTRVFLTIVLPLLLPAALYVLWVMITDRAQITEAAAWRRLPWAWLVVAGVAMAAAVLVIVVETGGGEGSYVAPHLEDGHVVPGHVVPAPATR